MPNIPNLNGQLGWDPKSDEPQYILTWNINGEQPILKGDVHFSFVNGGIEQKGIVDIQTSTTSVKEGGTMVFDLDYTQVTVTIPKNAPMEADGKPVTGGDTLCSAVARGYSGLEPPAGKQILELYVLTSLRFPDEKGKKNVPEIAKLGTEKEPVTLKVYYDYSEPISDLTLCGWDEDAEKWIPYPPTSSGRNEIEIATTTLGLYALMAPASFTPITVSSLNYQDELFKAISESALASAQAAQASAQATEDAIQAANVLHKKVNGTNGRNGGYA